MGIINLPCGDSSNSSAYINMSVSVMNVWHTVCVCVGVGVGVSGSHPHFFTVKK